MINVGKRFDVLLIFLMVLLNCGSLRVQAFTCSRVASPRSGTTTPTRFPAPIHHHHVAQLPPVVSSRRTHQDTTALYQASYLDDSNGRGLVLLTLALFVCVWSFSIPPELRREHICTVSRCVEQRSKCYDCVTLNEWTEQVVTYYRNGGGVNFDFSIDPQTLEFWANVKK